MTVSQQYDMGMGKSEYLRCVADSTGNTSSQILYRV